MPYHPVSLISLAIEHIPLPCQPEEGICAITGQTGLTIPRQYLFGKSFTNLDLLAAPGSNRVSIDAYQALKYKWERMSSFFCDGKTFIKLDRIGVRDMVFSGEMPSTWVGYATTSYKKHGALRTPLNTGNRRLWLFEMQIIDCGDMIKTRLWWGELNKYLRLGLGRSILETLNCPPYILRKIGLPVWLSFKNWASDKYQSRLYQFLCYLLPSQEELKNGRA